MSRSKAVFSEVANLYSRATTPLGKWMWDNHVQWVANKTKTLAKKYRADAEKAYCAAVLHDLADYKYERGHEEFDNWSKTKAREVLKNAGFGEQDVEEIIEVIIGPHSCRPGNLPTTLEGEVLATADAMFHLQTSFFPLFCYLNRPERANNYEEWQEWFTEKIKRDYSVKIFFEDERNEVKDDYEALSRVFANKTLNRK